MKKWRELLCSGIVCASMLFSLNTAVKASSNEKLINNKNTGKESTSLAKNSKTVVSIPEKQNGNQNAYVNLPKIICNNTKIEKLILSKKVEEILDDWYYETDFALFQGYSSITPNCPNLETIEVAKDNPYLTSVDGLLYSKNMERLYYCPPAKQGDVVIPEGVKQIGKTAFQDCSKLTSIHIPSSVTDIAEGAFGGNTSLTTLQVEESNKIFKSESNVVFTIDGEQLVAYAGGKADSSYTIPDGVGFIRYGAFMGSNKLNKIITPESLSIVGNEAFRNCNNLRRFNLPKEFEKYLQVHFMIAVN